MSGRQAALGVVLSAIIAACSAGAEATPSDPAVVATPRATSSLARVSPTPTAFVATPTPAATPEPTPTSTPKPTPAPVPPKPTALEWQTPCMLDCRATDNVGYGVTWKAPRTKGVEIRVYGVTKCFRTDAPDGRCLRKHTALPDDIRVLLAKGPASKGELYWDQQLQDGIETAEGCVMRRMSQDGTPFYSTVVAAYNESGHSVFAIVDAGRYEAGECGVGVDTY